VPRRLAVAVFLSGASALAFEVIFERALRLAFGSESRAAAATLAAYMAGLALGGPLGARLARGATRPARKWAAVEAVAAILFVACLSALPLARAAYLAVGGRLGPVSLTVLRIGLAFFAIVPATAISAAAWPLALAAIPDESPRRSGHAAALVSANLAGAATGAALAALAGLRVLGMHGTALGAAIVGLAAAAVAASGAAATDRGEAPPPPAVPRDVVFAAAVSGFGALSLEVVLLRIVAVHTTAGVYAFALVLVAALAGLALGGRIAARRLSAQPAGAPALLSIALRSGGAVGLATVLAAPILARIVVGDPRTLFDASPAGLFVREAALAAALLGPAFVIQGLAWPAVVGTVRGDPASVGTLLAANLGGAATGALVTGFVTLPGVGLRGAAATVAVTGALGGLVGIRDLVPALRARRARAVGLVASACLLAAAIPVRHLKEPGGDRVVFYREGADAIVTVREGAAGRVLRVDGQTVASSFGAGVTDARMLAHLPLLLHGAPKRALTVGFGSGGTSRAMTLHGVRVDAVEIEPAVIDAARLFRDVNLDVLAEPRLRILLEDARDWLGRTRIRYDVVASDCTNLMWGQNGMLYTREYWSIVKARLAPGGIAVAWMPLGGIGRADLGTLVASFRAVFPHATIHYFTNAVTNFFLLVGTPDPLRVDADAIAVRMREPAVAADLEAIGLPDPYRVAASLLVSEEGTRRLARGARLHTDDRPILDYRTPYRLFRPTAGPRLEDLLAVSRLGVRPVGRDAERSVRALTAERVIARGNAALLEGHVLVARDEYHRAAAILPGDPAIPALLEEAGVRR